MSTSTVAYKSSQEKYCKDCASVIWLNAEICPKCGCRQIPESTNRSGRLNKTGTPSVGMPLLALFVLNALWNGLGNVAVGDKRGWLYMLFNIIMFIGAFFTFGIGLIAFYVYCGAKGTKFVLDR
jgi:hypothetical protein